MNAAALLASKAYGSLPTPTVSGPQVAPAKDFGAMLAEQVSGAISASKNAETQATAAATGKADLVNVVTAISAAEVQMETMIAFRDQAIQAYQEIARMSI